MMSRSRIRAVAAIAAVCALCSLLAQLALWLHLNDQARADRQHHLARNSQLYFKLDRPVDLIGGRALDVQGQSFAADGLRLDLAAGASNIPIGFDGRCLQSHRFPLFTLDINSSRPFVLVLAHSPKAGGEQRVTEIPLRAGALTLRVDMRELQWQTNQQPRSLGDSNGRICEFRLVPVVTEPTQLQLSRLRFSLAADANTESAWSDAIALPTRWQRPERVLQHRDSLRTHADQEIWPDSTPKSTLRSAPSALRLFGGFAPVLAFTALAMIALRTRRRMIVVMALAGPVLLLASNQLGEASDVLAWTTIGVSSLALIILGMVPGRPRIHFLGTSSAWREAMYVTGIVLLLALLVHLLVEPTASSWPHHTDVFRYVVWAAIQQTLLQRVLIPELNRPAATLLSGLPAATAFALLHTPNFSLMLLCLLAGLWWSKHFARQRSWLPLVTAHVVLGTALPLLLPTDWLYSAEVGARFFTSATN